MANGVRISAVLLSLLGTLIVSGSAQAQLKGSLTVEVDGLSSQKGLICLKLFSGSRGFPNSNESAVRRQCSKITETPATVTFKDLNLGSYAVAVYHDLNGDQKLNRNLLGMPTEGYGFSKNPVVRTGPPKFGDAVFLLVGSTTSIKVQMQYPKG